MSIQIFKIFLAVILAEIFEKQYGKNNRGNVAKKQIKFNFKMLDIALKI